MTRRISAEDHQKIFHRLVENAIDFLVRSIDEIEERPKYSIIHFHAAVELFLKARLASEHWALVVTHREQADWRKFVSGDFRSVSLDEAAKKIDKILQNGLTNNELKAFRDVMRHRNKVVHFFHEANYEEDRAESIKKIVKQQLRAWYFLHRILNQKWEDCFEEWSGQISDVNKKLKRHKAFLQVVFDEMNDTIKKRKKSGDLFLRCASCEFEAQEHSPKYNEIYRAKCLVCDIVDKCIKVACFECESDVYFINEGFSECPSCSKQYDPENIACCLLDENKSYPAAKDEGGSWDLGNCGSCDGHQTVVRTEDEYVCASCFEQFDSISQCDWCGDLNTGDMEYSYVTGCNQWFCEGLMGHEDD